MNLLVAAEVTRRTLLIYNTFRLLTSAATVHGFKARTLVGGILTPALSPKERGTLAIALNGVAVW